MSRQVLRLILLCLVAALMAALLGPRADPAAATGSTAAIDAGGYHTCALSTAGGLTCWGWNVDGQLGNGSSSGPQTCGVTHCSRTPIDVSGLTSGVAAVTAGGFHTCALTTTGGIKCWGWNFDGELGDGTNTNHSSPVDVTDFASGVTAVSANGIHTCAVTTVGGVKCWGKNDSGELGDGTTTERTTPVDVSGLSSGIAAISTGDVHTCALTTAAGVKCWGQNASGELGNGTTTNSSTPVDVSGLASGVAAVSAGAVHTCALTTSGAVKCWGSNGSGELGDSTTTDHSTPVDVSGLTSGVAAVSAGGDHTCALTTTGGVKCWGENSSGELGDGTTTDRATPVNVSGLTGGVAAISAGSFHTCALTNSAGVKCWGDNSAGALGDGTTTNRTTPVDVVGLVKAGPTATAAPTPTPPQSVGGIVKLPDVTGTQLQQPAPRSTGDTLGPFVSVAAAVVAVAIALAAGIWFARRPGAHR